MSAPVSCPVFRCAKTSVSKCTGFRRKCERYYCQTHTKGTLCDGCAFLKQEDMKAKYRDMLRSLIRKSHSVSRTPGVIALFLISVLLLGLVAVRSLWESSNSSGLTIIMLLG